MAEVLPFPWDTFCQLQRATALSLVVTPRTIGREEALTALAEDIAAGNVPAGREEMERRFSSLSANRAAKYRQRGRLERLALQELQPRCFREDSFEGVAIGELSRLTLSQVSPQDRQLLREMSIGMAYSEIASKRGWPVGTLKAHISRLRRRVRESRVGELVQHAWHPKIEVASTGV